MSHLQITLLILILIFLILLTAFFSCAETAFMAVNHYRLKHKARQKKLYAMELLKLLKRPDRLLGAILIGSTFASMSASAIATILANYFFAGHGLLLAIILFGFIIFVLIFSEITPKTMAAIYPNQTVRFVVYPIKILLTILYPAVLLANAMTNSILRMLNIKVANYQIEPLSRDELRSIVYDTTGKMSRQYQHMLLGILDLNKLTVDDVMVPKRDVLGIDMNQSWEKMLEEINRFPLVWAPVYRGDINQVIGVLYVRDVLTLLMSKQKINKDLIHQLLQEPYFVPQGTSLYAQLIYFQQNQNKIAFIVDEYGEVQGLLTLNDILEEIVGDFTSSVSQDKRVELQADGSYLVDGATTVREFNRRTNFELPLKGPRTINGLVVEYLEALPHIGTAILIAGYPIEIIKVKDNRVKTARIFPKLTRRK